jgi:signal transduction histidine kinase/ActR/RegA family two-component response regulator
MKLPGVIVPIVAGPLLVLTYLLLHAASPNVALHERTLDALRMVILNEAALERDVLRARAGLLRNYDPLVQSVANLRSAAATLRAARRTAVDEESAEIDRQIENVTEAIAEQEAVVEDFKSRNALLQNSQSYFNHSIRHLPADIGDRAGAAGPLIGALSNGMAQFTSEPDPELATEVTSVLDRLAQLPTSESYQREVTTLIPHARLIIATLPEVDHLLSRLLAAPTSEQARSLQDLYLSLYGRATARAGVFRILLYIASIALVAYVGYLFLRLRTNARTLQARLAFENLISGISTQFINLARDRLEGGINEALAQLARHAEVERASLLFVAAPDHIAKEYRWHQTGAPGPNCGAEDLLAVVRSWSLARYHSHGYFHVPRVRAMPESSERTFLQNCGVRSWLCISMGSTGKPVGYFTLERTRAEQSWPEDDVALLRTAGEIFANAIDRERTEFERDALEARLQHGQRLEAVGTLAGGIAHDFNNILGAVQGYGELALAELTESSQARRYLRQIIAAGERAQRVVDQILAFSRRDERKLQPLRARAAVEEALDLLHVSLPKTLVIEAHLEAGEAAMLGDRTRVQQVVVNLCTNGAQAMEGRGTLRVSLDTINLSGDVALTHGDLARGDYIRLAVEDSGHGIDEATMQRMFEPFFTTKAVGSGTGLGLATVHGIVTQHGGALNVRSKPNVGSTFEVYFPRLEEAAVGEESTQPTIPYGHGETILLVDDEDSLVTLGEEMLAALRYEPVGFYSAGAALASFRRNAERYDLVLTDEVMPEMTGTELAAALHQLRPELPVVLMTGYSGSLQASQLQAAGICEVINKPVSSGSLADCIARHLSVANNSPSRKPTH